MLNLFTNKTSQKIQNLEWGNPPEFAVKPFWFLSSRQEKCVKIGKRVFNYMDYLECWCNIDCGTHRSLRTLENKYREIKAAFEEVDRYNPTQDRKLFRK